MAQIEYSLVSVIIQGLEEQLFVATKEKENLEDDLQIQSQKVRNKAFR